jgi:hypothetical protein
MYDDDMRDICNDDQDGANIPACVKDRGHAGQHENKDGVQWSRRVCGAKYLRADGSDGHVPQCNLPVNHAGTHRNEHNWPWESRLTVFMEPDSGPNDADRDIELIKAGSPIQRKNVSELYFLQLRLRVAQDPSLASMIDVRYDAKDGRGLVPVPVTGKKGEVLGWPPGFLNMAWRVELDTQQAYHDQESK